jgi:hypothetical protein
MQFVVAIKNRGFGPVQVSYEIGDCAFAGGSKDSIR